jgi:hypothetical protein
VNSDTYWSSEFQKKKDETITELLDAWSESLGLQLREITFVTEEEVKDM